LDDSGSDGDASGSGSTNAGGTNTGGVGGTGVGGTNAGGTSAGGTGGSDPTTGFVAGAGLNQCGIAAPSPADTGTCKAVAEPRLTDFDDYATGAAQSYTFYVNAPPPAENAVSGGFLHVGDGSDTDAGSVIATEMVPGVDGTAYALQFSNDNAVNWGGLLMLQFTGATPGCLNASDYAGIELSIKGTTPSGNVGVNLGMLDTMPSADGGLCDNATATDCKDASLRVALPSDPDEWKRIQIPWSAFTPGVGSDTSCVPLTGENVARLVIQPQMVYAPPDWAFAPGAYSVALDDIRFYGTHNTSGDGLEVSGGECDFPESLSWTTSDPIITPVSDASHTLTAVKDPSIVSYGDEWHVFASSVSTAGAYNLVYTSFSDFSEAGAAPLYYMDETAGFDTYVAAPQVFFFTPQNKWYLVFQSGPPMYSTTDDISDPTSWTAPKPFYTSTPAIITANGGGWLDYWVICESAKCHLFFSSNQGRYYRAETAKSDFPNGFGEPVVVFEESNAGRVFEGSNVYKIEGTDKFLAIIEAFDQTSNDHRYFRSWVASSLEGPWLPWQASGSFPFAGSRNVSFEGTEWTQDISHGEMIRSSYDETLTISPCNMRYIFQGADPLADTQGEYNKIPWHLGLLTQSALTQNP
jgi:hypothetical protein